jgi:hypothetical protein
LHPFNPTQVAFEAKLAERVVAFVTEILLTVEVRSLFLQ